MKTVKVYWVLDERGQNRFTPTVNLLAQLSHVYSTIEVAHFFPSDEKKIPVDEQGVVIIWLKSVEPSHHFVDAKGLVNQYSWRMVESYAEAAIMDNAVLKVSSNQRQSRKNCRAGDAD